MIIGTAGHIDHGKSALVTALTGKAMDRLAEERRRGITIDLNFAPLELDGVVAAGIVDVPGHEDFVRTMVAGASGIDLVLLVVDAVEGIRPQTLEHLAVVEQLAIPQGIPVLTKVDVADPDWVDLVEADLGERLAGSSVRFGLPARVSSVTGTGIEELRERIRLSAPRIRRAGDLTRLPIDRAFSLAGVGTVVTGTLWSGSVAVGDAVRLEPGGLEGRVRSVESHGRAVERAEPGWRTAVGLAGVDAGGIGRGLTLLSAGDEWSPTRVIDAVIHLLPEVERPLASRTRIRVHHATAEVMARVYPRESIRPGSTGPARVVLEEPLVARGGDRFVIRSYSPVSTIGGGWIADPEPPRKASWPLEMLSTDADVRRGGLLRRRIQGIPVHAVSRLVGEGGALVRDDADTIRVRDRILFRPEFEAIRQGLLGKLEIFHRQAPAVPGISLETLRSRFGPTAWQADEWLTRLEKEGLVRVQEGLVALASHQPVSGGGDAEVAALVKRVEEAGLEGITVAQLASLVRVKDLRGALIIGVDRGLIEAVEHDRYLGAPALARATEAIRAAGQGNIEIQPGAVRDQIGLSRKHVIPLLEWADRKGITWRDRDGRRKLKSIEK